MVTTIRRGWWPAFGPALLAFTAVVCGSLSLPAIAQASVIDGRHPSATIGSSRGIAASSAAPTRPAYIQEDPERDQDTDVIVDDDDHDDDDDYDDDDDDGRDDGGATDLGGCAHAVIRGSSSILILSAFDALVPVALDNHSLRAPPR